MEDKSEKERVLEMMEEGKLSESAGRKVLNALEEGREGPFKSAVKNGKINHQKGMWTAISGVILSYLGPLLVYGIIAFRLIYAFDRAKVDHNLTISQLANRISTFYMWGVAAGVLVGGTGLIFLFLSLLYYKYDKVWFFWSLLILSFIWLIFFPIGTIAGIISIIYLFSHRKFFYKQYRKDNE